MTKCVEQQPRAVHFTPDLTSTGTACCDWLKVTGTCVPHTRNVPFPKLNVPKHPTMQLNGNDSGNLSANIMFYQTQ